MKIVSALAGGVLGLCLFGLAVGLGTTLGLPSGLWWWTIGIPFVVMMGYLAAIQD